MGVSTQLAFCCPEDPHALLSCQITPLHFPLCMGLIRLLIGFTRPRAWLRLRSRLWTASFPRSRPLSRPWPRLRRLGTGLSAFGFGRPAFPAVDYYLARLTRRRTAAGGDASAAWLRLLSPTFAFRAWLWVLWDDRNDCSGPGIIMVVLARMPESAKAGSAAGILEPCRQLSQRTSTCV